MSEKSYLTTFLPSSVLGFLAEQANSEIVKWNPPLAQTYSTAVLFADVSGFTAMCEAMAAKGAGGDESLAVHLNSYFELLVRNINSQGGDVFKFAGDALLVLWPPAKGNSEDNVLNATRRAAQCGLDIQNTLNDAVLEEGVRLNVKVGIGCGDITIVHLGGVYNRYEYLPVGAPLAQAFHAEHQATKREVIASPEAWKLIEEYFEATSIGDLGHAFIGQCINPLTKVNVHKALAHIDLSARLLTLIGHYIPTAVVPMASQNEDKWISELRNITTLFVNLGVSEQELVNMTSEEDIDGIHRVLKAVQEAVYQYEGSLNKFLMDDKGSTLVAVFGLPPLTHENDSLRGILAAHRICDSLHQLNLRPSIGITTGSAFCGVVGSRTRREYSVLGDTVNLSARIMQFCCQAGAGVLCDIRTVNACQTQLGNFYPDLAFYRIAEKTFKGKTIAEKIYQPIQKKQATGQKQNIVALTLKARLDATDPVLPEGKYDEYLRSTATEVCRLLAEETDRGCILIRGAIGMGKSKLMDLAVAHFMSKPENKGVQVEYGAGTGIDSHTLLGVWRPIMTSMINKISARTGFKNDPRAWVRSVLEKEGCGREQFAPCLNQVLGFEFEETDATEALAPYTRLEQAQYIIVAIVQAIVLSQGNGSQRSLMILIEDAVFLDPSSWELAQMLVHKIHGLMIIATCRPMDKLHMSAFAQVVPPLGYEQLVGSPLTAIVDMAPRDQFHILKTAALLLSPPDVEPIVSGDLPNNLIIMTLHLSEGNPGQCRSFIRNAMERGLVSVEVEPSQDTTGLAVATAVISPDLLKQFRDDEPAEMLPHNISKCLGSLLDRLPLPEQMILKLGSIMGDNFSFDVVKEAYPLLLESNTQLDRALDNLKSLDLVQQVEWECVGSDDDNDDRRNSTSHSMQRPQRASSLSVDGDVDSRKREPEFCYKFTNPMVRFVILTRMLDAHRTTLSRLIPESFRYKYNKMLLEELPPAEHGDITNKVLRESLLEGWLWKAGKGLKKWKTRYFILFSNRILYYKSTKMEKSKGHSKGRIFISPESTVERVVKHTQKAKQDPRQGYRFDVVTDGHAFHLAAECEDDVLEWVTKIRTLIQDMVEGRQTRSSVFSSPLAERQRARTATVGRKRMPAPEQPQFPESIKEGYLCKTGDSFKGKAWRQRYFVLFNDKLLYQEDCGGSVSGFIDINVDTAASINTADKHKRVFSVTPTPGGRTFMIRAWDEEEANDWVEVIRDVVHHKVLHEKKKVLKIANHSVMEGPLQKRGGGMKRKWQHRYFVLFDDKMQYFEVDKDDKIKYQGEFALHKQTFVELENDEGCSFHVQSTPKEKRYSLSAKDHEEAKRWVAAIAASAANQPESPQE